MIQKLNKSQMDKSILANNETNINSNNKKLIDAISVKLKNNKSNSKENNSDNKLKSNPNDSNLSDATFNTFEEMLLHSDKSKIELFKKNKLKELKLKAEQDNIKFTNKPLSEINGLITELSGLFAQPKNIDTQFANDSKDKFIDMIFDNFEELIDIKENSNIEDISKNVIANNNQNSNISEDINQISNSLYSKLDNNTKIKSNTNSNTNTNKSSLDLSESIKEFNPDNYDILNPLSELKSIESVNTNIINPAKTKNNTDIQIDNNVLSEANNPKNLKYNLKDLISLIKNAIENDNSIQKKEIESHINSILINQSKDTSLLDSNQKRISDLVNKNTNEMVNEFLPKYFFKSDNSKSKTNGQDINNSNFTIKSDAISSGDFDNFIKEISLLEKKLSKIDDKSSIASNALNVSDKKDNIVPSGEIKPTLEVKSNDTEKVVTAVSEKSKENNTENSEKSPNFSQNLNLEANKNTSVNNIIKRANSIEFQSFNNVGLNELNSTTTIAAIKTPENSTSMVRITMNPDSLGTVFVEIKMNGEEASINFKSVDKEVISTLENNIKELQASLKNENIELKSLVIDYKDYDKELNQENSARNQEEQNNKDKKQENKNLYKDLSKNQQEGINLDADFYNNLKNYAEYFRENSTIYKDVTSRNSNLENLKIKTKIIEKYS